MAVSAEDAQLLASSWELVKQDIPTHAVQIYRSMFEIAPEVRDMFSFARDRSVPLEKNTKLLAHATIVLKKVGNIASQLGDPTFVADSIPGIQALAKRHINYKTEAKHFAILKSAILDALEKGLGPHWTPQLAAAWTKAIDALCGIMLKAMEE